MTLIRPSMRHQPQSQRSASRTAFSVAVAVVTALSAAGCAQGGIRAGTAFEQIYSTTVGAKPVRPGFELGLLYVFLDNSSKSTLDIDSIGISGPGIGTVVQPVQVEIAPLRFGRSDYETNATPGALYTTDPPVNFVGTGCREQALFPVKGYRMTPGSQARIWIVLRALRPGKWVIPAHVVYYTLEGMRYRQAIPLRAWGSVASNAAYIPPYWAMAKCVAPTGARLLSGYHLGKTSR